jgi:hypothetical protein
VTNRRAQEGDFLCDCSTLAVAVGLLADLNALLERELLNFCATLRLRGNLSSSSSSKKLPVGHAGLVATKVDEEESLVLSTAFLPGLGDSRDMSTVSPDQREGGLSETLVCWVEDPLGVRMRGAVWGRLGDEVGEEGMAEGWRRTDMHESERERSEAASEEVRGRGWLVRL